MKATEKCKPSNLGKPEKCCVDQRVKYYIYFSIYIGGENLKLTVSPCNGVKPQKNVSPMYARSRL